jgi:hypothetical protein
VPANRQPKSFVDHETFLKAVEPCAAMLKTLTAAGYAAGRVDEERGRQLPAPDSAAMSELDQQSAFAGVWDENPIDTAQTHIGLLLTAGEDAMETFATAIVADRTPLYSYIPIARAGMECLALAHWLAEPGIGARERVRRSINERIASAYEQSRLPAGLNPEPGRKHRLLAAESLGFSRTTGKGKLTVLAPDRPSITHHIQRAVGNDQLGKVLYSYASAISHGTIWGLAERAEPLSSNSSAPVVTAALTVSSTNIAMMAIALAYAHIHAYGGYIQHMGWDTHAWTDAVAGAQRTISTYLDDPAPSTSAPPWGTATPGGLWLP